MTPLDPILRDLSSITRWGITRTIQKQSLAEHQYFVCLYTCHIAPLMGVTPTRELMMGALIHDVDELHSGDIPAPYKARLPTMATPEKDLVFAGLSVAEAQVIKVADLVEAALFLVSELSLGNQMAQAVLEFILIKLEEACAEHPAVHKMVLDKIAEHSAYKGRAE